MRTNKRKQGEGTVRLRKDGRWEGRIVVGYDEKGNPKSKGVFAKTKTECEDKLRKLKKSLGKSVERFNPDMPFGECAVWRVDGLLVSNLLQACLA